MPDGKPAEALRRLKVFVENRVLMVREVIVNKIKEISQPEPDIIMP